MKNTNWTQFHAKYFAYELTQRIASRLNTEGFSDADNLDKLTASLSDAQVDLNPHQVDAALFALRSPLSHGVILADEVGLGKTIEAGIVIAQRWAERRRRILIIVPANLRKQWSQELADKFFLPSLILEKKSFDEQVNKFDNLNPFNQSDKIVLCSFQFVRSKEAYIRKTDWDLVIIDEAHRLRNVHRKDNKIGNAIKNALAEKPKILLTATPLQNSLLELFGLVSIVDDFIFGDKKSFQQQYSRITNDEQFEELKRRIAPVCKRTLRAQVREYIRYTDRVCLTQEFEPNTDEHELYLGVSEYLRKDKLYALPNSQRKLMTLILRKILASSSFAIADTLKKLVERLEKLLKDQEDLQNTEGEEAWQNDFDNVDEMREEWNDDPDFDDEDKKETKTFSPQEIEEIWNELAEVRAFHTLAQSIQRNSKGDCLLIALEKGFEKMREHGGAEKAVIFTESVRTQTYIRETLEQAGFKGKIVLFNGSNNDPNSTRIYQEWLKKNKDSDRITGSRANDIRAALTEYFRDEAQILIATEAAAEGINLQFCSMVVNYDMPWNPQRIEQRIGRCHRYGQRFNVVVINFLNKKNAADKRVYQLLTEKFLLFNGVFGASDEVLGSIESGVDFEKRIIQIYQNYSSEAEINAAFDKLRDELDPSIQEQLKKTHQQLLANFDEEVLKKIKMESLKKLSLFEDKFWQFSRFALADFAEFGETDYIFDLKQKLPFAKDVPIGKYQFMPFNVPSDKLPKGAHLYRFGHPLAQALFEHFKTTATTFKQVVFDYTASSNKVSILESLLGESGFLAAQHLRIEGIESEDFVLFSGITTEGVLLDNEHCEKLFSVIGKEYASNDVPSADIQAVLRQNIEIETELMLKASLERHAHLLNIESQKLETWADDRVFAAEQDIKDTKKRITELKRHLNKAASASETLQIQKDLQEATRLQTTLRRRIFEVEDEVAKQRDALIDKLKAQNKFKAQNTDLFIISWTIK